MNSETSCKANVDLTPSQVRDEFRHQTKRFAGTCGLCPGHLQAGIHIFPSSFADDFEEFCKMNSAPLPLVYRSSAGRFDAPPVAKDSDARTDVGLYSIFENGIFTRNSRDISGLDLSDMTCFYIGCSHGFDDALARNGVDLAHSSPGSGAAITYLTGIPNYPVGPFAGTMFVSMRPVKRSLLEMAYDITGALEGAHGAPIHIGDPELIGADLSKPLLGSGPGGLPQIADDEVPVFWGCGTSGAAAAITGKPPLYVGQWEHSVAFTFVADIKCEDYFIGANKLSVSSKIIQLTDKPLFMSALSKQAWEEITKLDCSNKDEENVKSEEFNLVKVALTLSHSSSVEIATNMSENQDEVIAILRALKATQKNVKLMVPGNQVIAAADMIKKAVTKGGLKEPIQVVSFIDDSVEGKSSKLLLIAYPDNTASRAPDVTAQNQPEMFSNLVKLPSRPPVMIDVQKFGGRAVAMAMFHLNSCTVHSRYLRQGKGQFCPLPVDKFVNGL